MNLLSPSERPAPARPSDRVLRSGMTEVCCNCGSLVRRPALSSDAARVGAYPLPALLSRPFARVKGKLNLAAAPADTGAVLPLLLAVLWVVVASAVAWRGYVRMVDEARAELVGVEASE